MMTLVYGKLTGIATSERTMRAAQATDNDIRLVLLFCDRSQHYLAVLVLLEPSFLVGELLVKSLMLTEKTAPINAVGALGAMMFAVRRSVKSTM